jgi:hypothetical protein
MSDVKIAPAEGPYCIGFVQVPDGRIGYSDAVCTHPNPLLDLSRQQAGKPMEKALDHGEGDGDAQSDQSGFAAELAQGSLRDPLSHRVIQMEPVHRIWHAL